MLVLSSGIDQTFTDYQCSDAHFTISFFFFLFFLSFFSFPFFFWNLVFYSFFCGFVYFLVCLCLSPSSCILPTIPAEQGAVDDLALRSLVADGRAVLVYKYAPWQILEHSYY
jgi:hypothetical protein